MRRGHAGLRPPPIPPHQQIKHPQAGKFTQEHAHGLRERWVRGVVPPVWPILPQEGGWGGGFTCRKGCWKLCSSVPLQPAALKLSAHLRGRGEGGG